MAFGHDGGREKRETGGCGHPPLRNSRRRVPQGHLFRFAPLRGHAALRTSIVSPRCHSEERSDAGIRPPLRSGQLPNISPAAALYAAISFALRMAFKGRSAPSKLPAK